MTGNELLEIIKTKVAFEGDEDWIKVATCLADDLALVIGRLDSVTKQIDALGSPIKTVYVVESTWKRDGDDTDSPQVDVFRTIEAARAKWRAIVAEDKNTGICSEHYENHDEDWNPEDDDWEITESEDYFYAHSDHENSWFKSTVVVAID
jgi:hypothetical protein